MVMDIEDYERDKAEKKLLEKLHEAEEAVKDGNGWLTMDELKAEVGEWRLFLFSLVNLINQIRKGDNEYTDLD